MISETTRKKMSDAHKGMKMPPRSDVWKQKQRIVQLGKKKGACSEERKKKIGDAQRGVKNHNWGKKIPEAVKEKIRKALRVRVFSPTHRARISASLLQNKHPNWKGGITPLKRLIRTNEKYNSWRSRVLISDGRRCIHCGSKENLEADHYPVSFAELLLKHLIDSIEKALECKELWQVKNGRTLCKSCHIKTESWGNKK